MSRNEQSDLKLLTRSEVEQEYGIGKRYLEVAATRREGPACHQDRAFGPLQAGRRRALDP